MLSRSALYAGLTDLGFHLPPLSDKSITLQKLQMLSRFELVALPIDSVSELNFNIRHNKEMIVAEINKIYTDELPFWFKSGRLPSKQYLLQVLHSLDSQNRLFGKNFHLPQKKRLLNPNEDCKNCVRRVNRYRKDIELKNITAVKPLPRPQQEPFDVDPDMNLAEKAKRICKSRHNVIALRRRTSAYKLRKDKFDDPGVQALLQKEIVVIDNLIDKLINLPN